MEIENPEIMCIGLMVCDIMVKPVSKEALEGDSTRIDVLKLVSGGDAFNAAVNLSKLGIRVSLTGMVGQDILGEYLIRLAKESGIETKGILVSKSLSTSTSIVLIEDKGERHFLYYGKANDALSLEDIDLESAKKTRIVHIGSAMALGNMDGKNAARLFQLCKSAGVMTSMDVTYDSQAKWITKIDETLRYTDIFMPSYDEARILSGSKDPENIAAFFGEFGVKILAIKLGSKGCFVTNFNETHYIGTFNDINPVDTTGAGDAFVSGFLAGIIKGWNIYECGMFGNAVASMCVSGIG